MLRSFIIYCMAAASLGCSGKSVDMPSKLAPAPTEPAKFVKDPNLSK